MAKQHGTRNCPRRTFAEILESTRIFAAERAFRRAIVASRLRKTLARRGRRRAAAVMADRKLVSVRRAVQLAPELIRVTIDCEFQVGLLSVRFADVGRLHLPAGADLTCQSPSWPKGAGRRPHRVA